MDQNDTEIGYGKPPKHTRFKKGRSGNPKGRPRKERLPIDLKAILERVANEEIEIGGKTMTMFELELRSLQRKAAKGEVAASRHLAKLRAEAGCGQPDQPKAGVLLLPAPVPLDEWSAAAARQQAQFRDGRNDHEEAS